MWIKSILLWMLELCCLCSTQDYSDYFQSGTVGTTQVADVSAERRSLDSVSSVDELLRLFYPEFSLMQQCLRRKAFLSSSSSSASPLAHANDQDLWGRVRGEALYKMDATLEVILEEIQRTSCRPREECVEVSKEYPQSSSLFYLPRCLALHRCGGCCNNEAFYCVNTSYSLVNKTLMQLSPPRMERSVVMVTFVNHTACQCLSRRPLHSVIRRSAAHHLCPELPCPSGSFWDPVSCVCIAADTLSYSVREPEVLDPDPEPELDPPVLCGPHRVLEESSCECVCQNGLTENSCEPGWRLDQHTCECQCAVTPDGSSCPPSQRWDDQLCGCVCSAQCPRNQPLNPDSCQCECRESPASCLRQGRRFNTHTCSCYRLPCRKPRRACQSGFYYSQQVCQCIPDYMRPQWK